MIRVTHPCPPANYITDVKNPGDSFLRRTPNPTNRDWNKHRYWSRIHPYLHTSLNGICSYCSSWTPQPNTIGVNDHTSIDHFIPKSIDQSRAYEWDNFRLCRARLNIRKSNFTDVLDPYTINNSWFHLDFSTFLIRPTNTLEISLKNQVIATIIRLELNSDNDYVYERIAVIKEYCLDNLTFNDLQVKYPFIASQMKIQNFDIVFKARLRALFV